VTDATPRAGIVALLALFLLPGGCAAGAGGPRVVLVTLDGVRWQEVFRGADPALGGASGGSIEERRRALMPFLWGTVAAQGQLFGNQDRNSRMEVANRFRVSYPGYHDLLCGFASPVIVGNQRVPNPDVTVLEWLQRQPAFAGKVAAFAAWNVFDAILNRGRSGLLLDVGQTLPPRPTVLERLRAETPPPWKDGVYDAFVFRAAKEYLDANDPRVLYIALGDTDEWAHAGRYDRYLDAVRRSDGWLRELWEALSTRASYRGQTSLIVTTDHGRGAGPGDWAKHDAAVAGAEAVWAAVIGPGTPALGERHDDEPLSSAQIAATVAALVGEDFRAAVPAAAKALPLGPAAPYQAGR
jgi:hypothetical protein